MSEAVSKVEIWEPGAGSALYTLTNECLSVYFKEILTSGIGNFQIGLPTRKETTYYYNDIDLFDKVKIWLGATTGNPNFIGKITEISGTLSRDQGYLRIISGLSQGETLLRRFKENKLYNAVGASDIVREWATDLGLESTPWKVEADATAVTLEVLTKTYFDLLRAISDYWYSAGSQIKKDFYVDVDNDLVWKARPLRTVGVPTLTVGGSILSYNVIRRIEEVKNNVTVYGAAENTIPADIDGWTESLTNWSASQGQIELHSYPPSPQPKFGTKCIRATEVATQTFKRIIPRVTIRNINQLKFWRDTIGLTTSFKVRLHAPDGSNYFETPLTTPGSWKLDELSIGPTATYDVDKNPTGIWTKTGSPNWWDIQAIEFTKTANSPYSGTYIDGLWFYPERWSYIASDGTESPPTGSQGTYGRRDMEATDDKLHSDAECEKRGKTLLYQHKEPPIQIVVVAKGDNNILIGDRIPLTIVAENINAVNYDVISVEQGLTLGGAFQSKATMMKSDLDIREPINTPGVNALFKLKRLMRELAIEERTYLS